MKKQLGATSVLANPRKWIVLKQPRISWSTARMALMAALWLLIPLGVHAQVKVSANELRGLQLQREPDLIIVDVRSPNDFALGHIQGARNIPSSDILKAGLSKDARVIVYCGEDACPLSDGAAKQLASAGYKKVFLLASGFSGWLTASYPAMKDATTPPAPTIPSRFAGKVPKDALPLDVRPAKEFLAGHLPGARSLPLEELAARLSELPKDRELLVYDRLTDRSHKAALTLRAAGFNVSELAGGLAAWAHRGLPLEVRGP